MGQNSVFECVRISIKGVVSRSIGPSFRRSVGRSVGNAFVKFYEKWIRILNDLHSAGRGREGRGGRRNEEEGGTRRKEGWGGRRDGEEGGTRRLKK